MNQKPILIVAGEPNSIFSEILVKSFKIYNKKKPIILFASQKLMESQFRKLKYKINLNILDYDKINYTKLENKRLNIVNIDYNFKKPFEKVSIKSNYYIEKCFNKAVEFSKLNKISGLINGPIDKNYFLNDKFYGITEYLAKKFKVKKNKFAMLIYNQNLSVSPITTHLPLKYVSKNINKEIIEDKVLIINEFYKKYFLIKPKIGITGLNPHCENFLSKSEEKHIIFPAIKNLKKKNIKIFGPYSADTIFLKNQLKKYDVVIGMYHDQVLTPIKTIYGFEAINITLGLPILRISPDHGPNYSMLGKNKSNFQSFLFSLNFLSKFK